MEDFSKIYKNNFVEEEYKKYIEKVKSEKHGTDEYMTKYLGEWGKGDRDNFRKKLIDQILRDYYNDPFIHHVISFIGKRNNNEKRNPFNESVESLIESSLYEICSLLLEYKFKENEILKNQLEEMLMRQPVRVIFNGEVMGCGSKDAIDKI